LVTSHLSAAQRFAIRLTGNAETAEDIVGESLVRAARSWQTYRGEARFSTWLFQIVVHVFRDYQARRRNSTAPLDDTVADPRSVDPAGAVAAKELSERIAAAVSVLPPRQREVLVLVVYENLTCAQAADILELNESAVRANLYLARQQLRCCLARYLPEHCHGG
jgi:RNA polymerase sigma-70 factor (ECF subfamily)